MRTGTGYAAGGITATAILLVLAGSGCSGSRALILDQAARIDSLETQNEDLVRQLDVFRDSIAFYDFIDSGEFEREMRFKETRVNRLSYELAVCIDGGETIATELVDDLFEPASPNLTASGRERLELLSDTLAARIETGHIHVEGYSDSTRPGGSLKEKYPSNWELSAARAAAIARYFTEEHGLDESKLVVISHGANRPISTNSTSRGRRLNRRIRFTFSR